MICCTSHIGTLMEHEKGECRTEIAAFFALAVMSQLPVLIGQPRESGMLTPEDFPRILHLLLHFATSCICALRLSHLTESCTFQSLKDR
jgi:hypothetical protein